jgi:hypothetical protein
LWGLSPDPGQQQQKNADNSRVIPLLSRHSIKVLTAANPARSICASCAKIVLLRLPAGLPGLLRPVIVGLPSERVACKPPSRSGRWRVSVACAALRVAVVLVLVSIS